MSTFTNRATLGYNGGSVQSNVVTGEITDALTIAKTALANSYGSDPVTYVVGIVNESAGAYTGLVLTDDLGSYEAGGQTVYPFAYVDGTIGYFVNGAAQPAPAVDTSAGLTVSGLSVPAGGNAVIVYSVVATEYAPRGAGQGVTNTAVLSGGGRSFPMSASATLTASETTDLSIFKSVSPNVVTGGGTLTYTFLVQNNGTVAAGADYGVFISDLFDPVLQSVSVTLDGAPLSSPADYAYDEQTGQFSTVAGVITVPAATVEVDPVTGVYTVTPGSATLTVEGSI